MTFINKAYRAAPTLRAFTPHFAVRAMSADQGPRAGFYTTPAATPLSNRNGKTSCWGKLGWLTLGAVSFSAGFTLTNSGYISKKREELKEISPYASLQKMIGKQATTKELCQQAVSIIDDLCESLPDTKRSEIEENLSKAAFTGPNANRDFALHVIKIQQASEGEELFLTPQFKFSTLTLTEMYLAYKKSREIILLAKKDQNTLLYLGPGTIKILPPEIGELSCLTCLIITRADLSEVPPQIGNLTNLTVLDLGHNKITQLPKDIGKLTELKRLNLTQNKLTELPASLKNLKDLENLDVSFNNFQALPSVLGKFHKLETLKMQGYLKKGCDSSWDDFSFWEKVLLQKIRQNNPDCDIEKDYVNSIFPAKPTPTPPLIAFLATITP